MVLPHFWIAVHPDVNRPLGGVKQIHRFAENLGRLGHSATLIQDSASFHPGWFSSDVKTISIPQWTSLRDSLDPITNVVVLPETYISSFSTYAPNLKKIIFNQNASYTYGTSHQKWFDPSVVNAYYHSSDCVHILCVSEFDFRFLTTGLGIPDCKVSLIPNSLDIFSQVPSSPVREKILSYMPRKNPKDSSIVLSLLSKLDCFNSWKVCSINNQPHDSVLSLLASTSLFLSFGYPEGFGLPLAEALASRCLVLGYSGLGGRELMNLGAHYGTCASVELGDWTSFVEQFLVFDSLLTCHSEFISQRLNAVSDLVLKNYSSDVSCASVERFLRRIETSLSPS